MTRNRRNLLTDAEAAGFTVTHESSRTTILRHSKTGRLLRGLVIFDDGTAVDATVRLDVAKGLRSYADMRAVLNIAK